MHVWWGTLNQCVTLTCNVPYTCMHSHVAYVWLKRIHRLIVPFLCIYEVYYYIRKGTIKV